MSETRKLRYRLDQARRLLRFRATLEVVGATALAAFFAGLAAVIITVFAPYSETLRFALYAGGALFVLATTGLVGWRRFGALSDDRVVARAIENTKREGGPSLLGELVAAVELADDAAAGSPALRAAHVRRSIIRLDKSGALETLSGRVPKAALMVCVVVGALFGAGALLLKIDALNAAFLVLTDQQAAQQRADTEAAQQIPWVTNLSASLVFPAYMDRPSAELAGFSGDLKVPLGTEVTLTGRADRDVVAAQLSIDDAPIEVQVGDDQRSLSVRFVVNASGAYRFSLKQATTDFDFDPVAHRVRIDVDNVPACDLTTPEEDGVVQLDEEIKVRFSGTDDYGLSAFYVVVKRQGSRAAPFEKEAMKLTRPLRSASGDATFTPREAGALPGDKLSLFVEASDGDTVSGPKRGRSKTRVLTVFSAALHHRAAVERQAELLDQLLARLADELEAPPPQNLGDDDVDAKGARDGFLTVHAEIHTAHADTLTLFSTLLADLNEDELANKDIVRALTEMHRGLKKEVNKKEKLVTNTARTLRKQPSVKSFVWASLKLRQRRLIEVLEKDVLYLDDIVNQQRLEEVESIADEIAQTQKNLKTLMEQYKEDPDDATRQEILNEVARLKEKMRELSQRLAELQRHIPDEHINREAMQAAEKMKNMDDIDRMIEEGRIDEAMKALEALEAQTQKLQEQMNESKKDFGGEEYKELGKNLQAFKNDLEDMKAEQQRLLDESEKIVQQAQKRQLEEAMKKFNAALDELKAKTKKAAEHLEKAETPRLLQYEAEDLAFAQARTKQLLRALEDSDIAEAARAAEESLRFAKAARQGVTQRVEGRFGSKDISLKRARTNLDDAERLVREVKVALDKIRPDPNKALSSQDKAKAKKNGDKQDKLAERAKSLRQQMEAMNKEVPLFGPPQMQAADDTQRGMQDAGKRLGQRDVKGSQRGQQSAMKGLESLQEALDQMSQQGQGGQGGGIPFPAPSGQQPGGDREGEGGNNREDDVKIPDADQYRVPDAFRRDILDAMREDAPKSFKDDVKRYYEELVK